jgi:hypothetical protein
MARRASVFNPVGMSQKNLDMALEKDQEKERRLHGQHTLVLADDDEGDGPAARASNVDIGDVIAYAKLRDYDWSIRKRSLAMLVLTLVSLVAFLVEIWVAYDEKACFCLIDDGSGTGTLIPDPDVVCDKSKCLVQSGKTNLLKMIISIATGLHILTLFFYYRYQLKSERNAFWYLTDSIMWRKHVWSFFALECLVILPHPFPTGKSVLYDDKLGALMFLRFYTALRVLRDLSPIYRKRKQLLTDPSLKKSGAVEFDWLLCVKFLFLNTTWMFVIIGVLVTWFTMAYVIWIFERESTQTFTLTISFWMTCITMTTVGYGDYYPTNNNAKVSAGVTAVLGIVLGALLVFAVMKSLTLSPQDTRVRNLWIKKLTYDTQKVTAASYIRLMWERYKDRLRVTDTQSQEYKTLLLEFNSKNAYLKNILLSCRRELTMAMELDDLVIDRLEDKMDDMTGNIADRLSYRLGLKPSRKQRLLGSTLDLKKKVDVMQEEQKRILAKIDAILKTIIASNGGIIGKIFS